MTCSGHASFSFSISPLSLSGLFCLFCVLESFSSIQKQSCKILQRAFISSVISENVCVCRCTKCDTRCSKMPNRWLPNAVPWGKVFLCHPTPGPNKITVQKLPSLSNALFYLSFFTAPFVYTQKGSRENGSVPPLKDPHDSSPNGQFEVETFQLMLQMG